MTISRRFRLIFFILTYTLSCLTISTNRIGGYFGYTSTDTLILKFVLIFIFVTVSVLINKDNLTEIVKYSNIFLNVLLILFVADFYIFNISGTGEYYRMWWLSAIYIANAGLFCGIYFCFDRNFDKLSRRFWIGFLPTLITSFLIIFARPHNTYYSVNTTIGKGLISSLDYLISHFHFNAWPLFNWIGNIVFFIPIPFSLKACFPKLSNAIAVVIGFLIPFMVEGYQYIFKCGNVDIDDIIFNCTGILIGFLSITIGEIIYNKKRAKSD